MKPVALAVAVGTLLLSGCGSLFDSTQPSPQAYVLRLPPPPESEGTRGPHGSVRVQRPEPGPGLDSERIVLLRSGRRFDFYAATRWAAPAPDLLESVMVDQLRASEMFSAVLDDASPYAPDYDLRCTLTRFESDYNGGGHAPDAKVELDCTLGRHRDRTLLAIFTIEGSAAAKEDRLPAVVMAFEEATNGAMGALRHHLAGALTAEQSAAQSR
jgi:ABC-type uncharacterized transport system auxiliary subunit